MLSFRASGLLAICACAYLGLTVGAQAQDAPKSSCFVAPAKLPDADVQAFLANPQALLEQYSGGGMAMQMRVRALAGSSPATLAALISLAAPAAAESQAQVAALSGQVAGIGGGLGRAARACVVVDPLYAGTIQKSVLESGNQPLIDAFNGANAEAPTAALGGGGGAGAGAGGAAVGGPGAGGAVGGSGSLSTQAGGSNGVGQSNGSLVASASSARFFSASSGGSGGSSSSVSPTAP